MKVLVVGATGGSGQAAVEALLEAGHEVTAFSRHADSLRGMSDRLRVINGDATRAEDVGRAVEGQDAVVVTLGITESPVRVRLLGSAGTPIDVRSRGTRHVIAAMREHAVKKLVVQTSYGVGESRDKLGLVDRCVFALLLRPQIADTEVQESEVRASGLDWVLAQPVHLVDGVDDRAFVSETGDVKKMKVSRGSVGRVLADAVQRTDHVGRTIAISAA